MQFVASQRELLLKIRSPDLGRGSWYKEYCQQGIYIFYLHFKSMYVCIHIRIHCDFKLIHLLQNR